jgi:hypothetical protein
MRPARVFSNVLSIGRYKLCVRSYMTYPTVQPLFKSCYSCTALYTHSTHHSCCTHSMHGTIHASAQHALNTSSGLLACCCTCITSLLSTHYHRWPSDMGTDPSMGMKSDQDNGSINTQSVPVKLLRCRRCGLPSQRCASMPVLPLVGDSEWTCIPAHSSRVP